MIPDEVRPGQPEEYLALESTNAIVQTPREALADYMSKIGQLAAGDLVWAKTMNFTTDEVYTQPLVDAWYEARDRGVHVQVKADSHACRVVYDRVDLQRHNGSRRGLKVTDEYSYYLRRAGHLLAEMQEMEQAGLLTFTRPYERRMLSPINRLVPQSFIPNYYRCDHSKQWGIIGKNRQYAWIGGVNLFDDGLGYTDAMVRLGDPDIVQLMYGIFNRPDSQFTNDEQHSINGDFDILVDAGERPWQSIIYNNFLNMIGKKGNREVQITSQFPLDPRALLTLARSARQGTRVRIAFSAINEFFKGLAGTTLYDFNKWVASHTPGMEIAHHNSYLHAKVVNIEGPDGQITSTIGSHNNTFIGVLFTSREMQLVSRNQPLNRQLTGFFENAWADSTPLIT